MAHELPQPPSHRAMRAFGRFVADDGGATAVEYGLMVALISVATMATCSPSAKASR